MESSVRFKMPAEHGEITIYNDANEETQETTNVHGVEIAVGETKWLVWVEHNALRIIMQRNLGTLAVVSPHCSELELRILDK